MNNNTQDPAITKKRKNDEKPNLKTIAGIDDKEYAEQNSKTYIKLGRPKKAIEDPTAK